MPSIISILSKVPRYAADSSKAASSNLPIALIQNGKQSGLHLPTTCFLANESYAAVVGWSSLMEDYQKDDSLQRTIP